MIQIKNRKYKNIKNIKLKLELNLTAILWPENQIKFITEKNYLSHLVVKKGGEIQINNYTLECYHLVANNQSVKSTKRTTVRGSDKKGKIWSHLVVSERVKLEWMNLLQYNAYSIIRQIAI